MFRIASVLCFCLSAWQVWGEPAISDEDIKGPQQLALESYVDGIIDATMREYHTVGLALAIVRDNEVVMQKGYGYADRKQRIKVDPGRHMFRIGSTTKTFTFTALMQLVEQGEIDIEADVNDYLSAFKVPTAFDVPVKVKDLLTHRPGWEENLDNLFVKTNDQFTSLEDYVIGNTPAQVFKPGTVGSYSNYGAALAGYIVEQVSGIPYEVYLEKNILQPLGMANTTARNLIAFDRPLAMPESLARNLVTYYIWEGGVMKPYPFELILGAPAGSMSSTAADMARYMLAHLGEGELNGKRILSSLAARQMRTRPYTDRPSEDYTHGFIQNRVAGYNTFEHGGATGTSFTSMVMVPDLKLGVFVSVNGSSSPVGQMEAASHILRYLIADDRRADPPPMRLSEADAAVFTGRFLENRRSHTTVAKLLAGHSVFDVAYEGEDKLRMTGGGQVTVLHRIGENSFQNVAGDNRVSFEIGKDGVAYRMYRAAHRSLDRVTQATDVRGLYWSAMMAILLSVTQLFGIWRRRSLARNSGWARSLTLCSLISAVFVLGASLIFVAGLIQVFALGRELIFAWPLPAIQLTGLLASGIAVLSLVTLIGVLPIFCKSAYGIGGKLHYTAFALALVNLSVHLSYWNMLGAS